MGPLILVRLINAPDFSFWPFFPSSFQGRHGFFRIFPIIGTALIWIPVAIYLFVAGNPVSALGVVIFGLLSSLVENFYKPIFISRRTKLNSSIILIGMIGGLFLFGILGIILGPLILAYLLIILEIYRNKKLPDVFIQQPEKE